MHSSVMQIGREGDEGSFSKLELTCLSTNFGAVIDTKAHHSLDWQYLKFAWDSSAVQKELAQQDLRVYPEHMTEVSASAGPCGQLNGHAHTVSRA